MSDILLNYINNDIHLSKKISNIELEFRSGVYFRELIEQEFNIKILNFNTNPKQYSEILRNFEILKNHLRLIGISFNDSNIKEIIEGKNGAAAKFIYKIKVEAYRKKINFNNISEKINKNSLREKHESKNNNINKNSFSNNNKYEYPFSTKSNSRGKLPNFTNFFKSQNESDKDKKSLNFPESNQFIKLKIFSMKKNKKEPKDKLFPNIKFGKNFFNFNNTFQNFTKKDTTEETLGEIHEEVKLSNKEHLNTNYLSTGYSNKPMKKAHSLYDYNDNLQKMKLEVFNEQSKPNQTNIEKINKDNLIKYSSFFNNSLKIGLNIDEITPNIKKNAIVSKKDFLFTPSQVKNQIKYYLSTKNRTKKIKFDNKVSPSSKASFLIEHKRLIQKSILNLANSEAKLFENRFSKNSAIYKRLEYTKKYDENNYNINRQLRSKKLSNYDITRTPNLLSEENKHIDIDEYINNIISENKIVKIQNNNKETDQKKGRDNYKYMRQITDLIIDYADLCYKSQIKLKDELIDIPIFREWNDLFIEGKSYLNILIKRKKNYINISSNDKINNSSSNNTKPDNKKGINKKNENIINDEIINMEYIDYLNFRGNWDINTFVNKELFGKQMSIFKILGNDIFKLLHLSGDLMQNLKQSIEANKILNNKEFELTEEELTNISVPETNVNNNLFGEIILLNYDNITNEYLNNKSNLSVLDEKEIKDVKSGDNLVDKIEESKVEIPSLNLTYIPIKICFIGHSFSGRKTQAKLLCEKYKNLKSYSINDITQFYIDEYKRLNMKKEPDSKNKGPKKNQINESKILEEINKYKYVFNLIEKEPNFDINKIEELTIEKISDDIKINLLIYQIKNDFPPENETENNKKLQEIIQKRKNLEQELVKSNAEQQNNDSSDNNDISKNKSLKKDKNPTNPKKNDKSKIIQNITEELEKLKIENLEGFILYDYPNTYNQMMKLENILTGYTQPIDKDIDIRDLQMNNLTNSIDKPYINISYTNPEISTLLNNINLSNQKSFFNAYFFIQLSEEETLKRMNNRLQDPNTGIIYHREYNPPNPNDKKLNDRLIELKEPNDDKIKELMTQFYYEYPKIFYMMNLFKNYYKIEEIEKNEVFGKIENYIWIVEKKYEERETNDTDGNIGNIVNDTNEEECEKNEIVRYLKRIKEIKRILPKEFSEEIIKYWSEIQDDYKHKIKNFIKNYMELKTNILEQMNIYQEEFIDFLNIPSKKYKLIDIFYNKYNVIFDKFSHIKENHLVKEEIENSIIELTGNLWKLIQDRKQDFISELDKIKNQNYIEENLELFGKFIINLIVFETKQYYNKLNIIKKFYYEFEKPKYSEKFPYEYNFKEESILEDINSYQIFVPFNSNDNESENIFNINETKIISPRLDKLYQNCFRLFFYYDQKMVSIKNRIKADYNTLMEQGKHPGKGKRKSIKIIKKKTMKELQKEEDDNRIIKEEEELPIILKNEKTKYKMRLLFIKNFAEKKLKEIYNIGQKTFNELDKYIIDSVNSQNIAMNELVLKIKKHVNDGFFKLNFKDVELDVFDIYEKSNLSFEQFNLDFMHSLPEEDKKINYKELYNIYLDTKKYEIQDNYISLNSFIDIVIKKYLFEQKSFLFMEYMKKMPFYYINNFINKFAIKKTKRFSIIKLNEIFTLLGLLNKIPPTKDQQNNIMKNISEKLKNKIYLSKIDFMHNRLWFEKDDKTITITDRKKEKNNTSRERSISKSEIYYSNKIKENNKEKKNKLRGSRVFPKLKFNVMNNVKDLEKEIPEEEQLKEYLFNINKNNDELIDFINFMKIISVKKSKNYLKIKSKIKINNSSDIKSNIDKDEIISINSIVESIDKTQISDMSIKILKDTKTIGTNNSGNNNIAKNTKYDKIKILKNTNVNEGTINKVEGSEEKININFPEYTYFDYLVKL